MPTALATYQRARFDSVQHGSRLRIITNGLVALAGIMTLSVGALRVMDGAMSAGALIAAMMIVWRVLMPIQTVSLNIARLTPDARHRAARSTMWSASAPTASAMRRPSCPAA